MDWLFGGIGRSTLGELSVVKLSPGSNPLEIVGSQALVP